MKKILDTELLIDKIDEKTHKKIKFNIEEEMDYLRVEFQYFPENTVETEYILNAFKYRDVEMTKEEALFFKEKYLKGDEWLKNLATVSIYHEDEYMGCAHRSSNKQTIILSPYENTPGFKNTRADSGEWEIVISLHGLHTHNMNIAVKGYVGQI